MRIPGASGGEAQHLPLLASGISPLLATFMAAFMTVSWAEDQCWPQAVTYFHTHTHTPGQDPIGHSGKHRVKSLFLSYFTPDQAAIYLKMETNAQDPVRCSTEHVTGSPLY